jgi:hypothetical protein
MSDEQVPIIVCECSNDGEKPYDSLVLEFGHRGFIVQAVYIDTARNRTVFGLQVSQRLAVKICLVLGLEIKRVALYNGLERLSLFYEARRIIRRASKIFKIRDGDHSIWLAHGFVTFSKITAEHIFTPNAPNRLNDINEIAHYYGNAVFTPHNEC